MKIIITRAVLDLLHERRIFTKPLSGVRWKIGDAIVVNPDAEIEPYANIFEGDRLPRRFGAFSYSHSRCFMLQSVGRYCSIAIGVDVMGTAHPAHWASSSPFSYFPHVVPSFEAYLTDRGVKHFPLHSFDQGLQDIVIGNDVWIGAQSLIKRGVTIGDGAVIGARSIVTNDIPPYAVAVGAPARIIRYRFDAHLIERFLNLRWWRFGPDMLQPLDVREPHRFLDLLEAKTAAGHFNPLELPILRGSQIIEAAEIAPDQFYTAPNR